MSNSVFLLAVITVTYFTPPLFGMLIYRWLAEEPVALKLFRSSVVLIPFIVSASFEGFFRIWSNTGMFAGLTLVAPAILLSVLSTVTLLVLVSFVPGDGADLPRHNMAVLTPWMLSSMGLSVVGVLLWRYWPYVPPRLF